MDIIRATDHTCRNLCEIQTDIPKKINIGRIWHTIWLITILIDSGNY